MNSRYQVWSIYFLMVSIGFYLCLRFMFADGMGTCVKAAQPMAKPFQAGRL